MFFSKKEHNSVMPVSSTRMNLTVVQKILQKIYRSLVLLAGLQTVPKASVVKGGHKVCFMLPLRLQLLKKLHSWQWEVQ